MQFTRLTRSPAINVANPGLSKGQMLVQSPSKIATLPGKGSNPGTNNGNGAGKVSNLPSKNADPIPAKNQKPEGTITPRRFGGGNSAPRLAPTQSRGSFQSMRGHVGRH